MPLTLAKKLKAYFYDIWFLWTVCLVLNIITFLFIYFKIHPGNKILALHYNVLAGVEWYGKGKNLYFLPTIGLAISALNFSLYRTLKDSEDFFSFLTVFVSLFVQLVLLVAIMFLASVN